MTIWFELAIASLLVATALLIFWKRTSARWYVLGLVAATAVLGWQGWRADGHRFAEVRRQLSFLRDDSHSHCYDLAGQFEVLSHDVMRAADQEELQRVLRDEVAGATRWIDATYTFCAEWRGYDAHSTPDTIQSCADASVDLTTAANSPLSKAREAQAPVNEADRATIVNLLATLEKAFRDGTPCVEGASESHDERDVDEHN